MCRLLTYKALYPRLFLLSCPSHFQFTTRGFSSLLYVQYGAPKHAILDVFGMEVGSDCQAAVFDTTINFDDPSTMYRFQCWVNDICAKSETHENFTRQGNAERLADLMVHPRIWLSIMFLIPHLAVKT
jgi:hypothetical protein